MRTRTHTLHARTHAQSQRISVRCSFAPSARALVPIRRVLAIIAAIVASQSPSIKSSHAHVCLMRLRSVGVRVLCRVCGRACRRRRRRSSITLASRVSKLFVCLYVDVALCCRTNFVNINAWANARTREHDRDRGSEREEGSRTPWPCDSNPFPPPPPTAARATLQFGYCLTHKNTHTHTKPIRVHAHTTHLVSTYIDLNYELR